MNAAANRFDVLIEKGAPDHIVLYEIYEDRAAFEFPREVRHFAQFNTASHALREGKKGHRVRIYE
jgi:quinol monooxygenase YgiN